MSSTLVQLGYIVAASLFILDLKWMSHPRTAVRGNRAGAIGMAVAVAATLLSDAYDLGWTHLLLGLAAGTAIGAFAAVKVKMTAMPQMVGLLNGLGGGASVLVAGAALVAASQAEGTPQLDMRLRIATVATALVGSVTLFGSYVAFGKLAEFLAVRWKLYAWQRLVKYGFCLMLVAGATAHAVVSGIGIHTIGTVVCAIAAGGLFLLRRESFPAMGLLKVVVFLLALAAAVAVVHGPGDKSSFWLLVALAGVLGVLLTWSIGGADMPVVIALLNSYSGIAAAATGFVIDNTVLVISGSLVGASGLILTRVMCKAMNRSLGSVVFSKLGPPSERAEVDEVYRNVKSTTPAEVAMMLETARRVVIVPGYGMAVAQAQHAVRDLTDILEQRFSTDVSYAIHPVAGRMPGHMNVLLAEADVPYEQLKEIDGINTGMETVDVCLVVGANDVVNLVARTDPDSPIAGMPIVDADRARLCVVIKRSLRPGFAGIPNPLFAMDNTLMLFRDAREAFVEIVQAIKET